ncbi:hypothetical protein Csa_018927 [Cucumis sativus]|uniref:Uncharacterized protein n=1 Tax=Cucumis sativus TaxID=3659 RepID=A0A0A0KCX7_CUCSA|nr:hypothetical protein Csa_018927 [Cucumis sativus]
MGIRIFCYLRKERLLSLFHCPFSLFPDYSPSSALLSSCVFLPAICYLSCLCPIPSPGCLLFLPSELAFLSKLSQFSSCPLFFLYNWAVLARASY